MQSQYSEKTVRDSQKNSNLIIQNVISRFGKKAELANNQKFHLLIADKDNICFSQEITSDSIDVYQMSPVNAGELDQLIMIVKTKNGDVVLSDNGEILQQTINTDFLLKNTVISLVSNPRQSTELYTDNIGTVLGFSNLAAPHKIISFFGDKNEIQKYVKQGVADRIEKANEKDGQILFMVDESGQMKGALGKNLFETINTQFHKKSDVSDNGLFFDASHLALKKTNEAYEKGVEISDLEAYTDVALLASKIAANPQLLNDKNSEQGLDRLAQTLNDAMISLNKTKEQIDRSLRKSKQEVSDKEEIVDERSSASPGKEDLSNITEEHAKKLKVKLKSRKR